MRELRFVTPGEETGHIVVETQASDGQDGERFVLPVTAELRAALAAASPPAEQTASRPAEPTGEPTLEASPEPAAVESPPRRPLPTPQPAAAADASSAEPSISPREIQVRVRAGEKPEEIAELFDADLRWVMRFAAPVIEERGRLTDEARRARARRNTTDAQTVIFGETVDARFSAHGIDPMLVMWDSHRREDGQWVISAHWVGGESERTAEWSFNLSSRTVTALDETATDLLSDRPIRPVFAEAPVTLTTAPPLVPGVVAFPAMPNAHTGPLPNREQLFDQQRFGDGPRPVAPVASIAPVAPVAPAAAPPGRPIFDAPPLPLGIADTEPELDPEIEPEFDLVDEYVEEALAEEVADVDEPTAPTPQVTNLGIAHRGPARPAETEDERAARAHIPSWDDILLGVRRKND